MLDRLCFYSVLFIFTISKVKSVWQPVYGIFLGWENHFSTLGLRLKSVNGGPSPQILMRRLTVFGFKQFWTSDFILLFALIVLSQCALKIGRINKILTRFKIF